MPSFLTTMKKFHDKVIDKFEYPPISAPLPSEWAKYEPGLVDLWQARANDEIVYRPIEIFHPEPSAQIEQSWAPVMKLVSLSAAQENDTIRLRSVNKLKGRK